MGWTSSERWTTKQDVINAVVTDYKLVTYSVNGNELWAVVYSATENPYIAVWILEKSQGSWAYKDMDESMGPFYYNCPQAFIDLVPCVNQEWRKQRVEWLAAKDAAKALKASISLGDKVTLTNGWTLTVVSLRPFVGENAAGKKYRIPKKMLTNNA